jgi:hypothetical protein
LHCHEQIFDCFENRGAANPAEAGEEEKLFQNQTELSCNRTN